MLGVYVVNEKEAIAMYKQQINISLFKAIFGGGWGGGKIGYKILRKIHF